MSLPAFSEAGQKRIAAARLEADAILARSQTTAKHLVSQARQMGIDPSGVGFSPGDTLLNVAREEIGGGVSSAAAHLFGAMVAELLCQGLSDMAAVSANLDAISAEVGRAYSVDQETLEEFKRQAHSAVLRRQAGESNGARRQLATECSSSLSSWADTFPKGSLAHRLLEDTSLLVKERTSVFASEQIGKIPKENAPGLEFVDFQATAISGAYEVWLSVLFDGAALTDDAAKAFEELCDEFAKTFLDYAANHALGFISKQALLTEVRTRMLQTKHHWIGKLLKKIRERKEIIRRATTVDPLVDSQLPTAFQKLSPSQASPTTEQVAPESESPSMAPTSSDPRPRAATPVPPKSAAQRWEDIEIVFTSEYQIQVVIGSEPQPPKTFAEMGFASLKNPKTPVAAWHALLLLAQENGRLRSSGDSRAWTVVESRIREIRKLFRNHFGLPDDPFTFTRKTRRNPDEFGYRSRFQVRRHKSYL